MEGTASFHVLSASSELIAKYRTENPSENPFIQEFPIEQGRENVFTYEIPEPLRALYEREVRIQEIHAAQPELSVEEVERMVDGVEAEAEEE